MLDEVLQIFSRVILFGVNVFTTYHFIILLHFQSETNKTTKMLKKCNKAKIDKGFFLEYVENISRHTSHFYKIYLHKCMVVYIFYCMCNLISDNIN